MRWVCKCIVNLEHIYLRKYVSVLNYPSVISNGPSLTSHSNGSCLFEPKRVLQLLSNWRQVSCFFWVLIILDLNVVFSFCPIGDMCVDCQCKTPLPPGCNCDPEVNMMMVMMIVMMVMVMMMVMMVMVTPLPPGCNCDPEVKTTINIVLIVMWLRW